MAVELHPRVLELAASRICHDLVSPVGAISNGVELMQEMGPEAGSEAMALVASSAVQASVRLKCFRLAYGAAGTDKNIGFRDVRDVFTDWLRAGRVQVEFDPELEIKFSMPPRGFCKCLLNMLLFAEECNHGEGKISLSTLEGNKGVRILATGRQVALRDGAETALKGEVSAEDLDPRSVHAYIAGRFAAHFGFRTVHRMLPEMGGLEIQLLF